jgi:hypothetical protein
MENRVFYGFISGIFVGKFTSLLSNVIIGGTILYFTEPDFYTYENINNITTSFINNIK